MQMSLEITIDILSYIKILLSFVIFQHCRNVSSKQISSRIAVSLSYVEITISKILDRNEMFKTYHVFDIGLVLFLW